MNLRYRDIEYLASFVVHFLEKRANAHFQEKRELAIQAIKAVFEKNFAEESAISDQAKKLLEANRNKLGMNFEEEKALSMIRKQLAKEKGFVL